MAFANPNLADVEKELESPSVSTSKNLIDFSSFEHTSVHSKMAVPPMDIEVTSESDDGSASLTPSTALTASQETRKGRFTITPAVDDFWMARVNETPKVLPTPMAAASVHNDTLPLIDNEDVSQYLGSDEPLAVEINSQRSSEEFAIPVVWHQSLLNYYTACSTYVADSLLIVPILLLLLGLSCLTLYMGIAYANKCDLMPQLPILIIFLGGCCILAFFCRIVYIIFKSFTRHFFQSFQHVTAAGIYTFVVVFIVELYLYFTVDDPSTEAGSHYCDPVFYNYVYWNNLVAVLVLILLAIVHVPACCCKKNDAEAL